MTYSERDIETFITQYVETALWSETDDDDAPLDWTCVADDIAPDSMDEIRQDCRGFITDNELDLAGIDPGQAGHDFWLTRNGHGAGFWDRGLGELGDRLTKTCDALGEASLYVGDNGRLHYYNR